MHIEGFCVSVFHTETEILKAQMYVFFLFAQNHPWYPSYLLKYGPSQEGKVDFDQLKSHTC